jgi:hypothetical protein
VHDVVKKLHTYAGLLSFAAFIVYGVAGLQATFRATPADRPGPSTGTRYVDFVAPGDLSDKALADLVHATLRLPLTEAPPARSLRRDAEGHLLLEFYTPNGPRRVTVLEAERRLRIETTQAGLWQYLSALHSTIRRPRPALMRAWDVYNEVAMFSLLFLSLSGVYLWLSTRQAPRLGRWSLALGSGSFIALFWWIW